MAVSIEIVTMLDDTIIDVTYVEGVACGAQCVSVGVCRYLMRETAAPRRLGRTWGFEGAALTYVLGSALAHLAVWLVLRAIPPQPATLSMDEVKRHVEAVRDYVRAFDDRRRWGPTNGTGDKQARAEGAMGKKDGAGAGRFHMKHVDRPHLAKVGAREAGLLAVMGREKGGLFAAVDATAAFSSGDYEDDVQGGLNGETGEAAGGYGFAAKGTGPGGGGTQTATIGKGGYGTIAHGSGTGDGFGVDGAGGGGGMHQAHAPTASLGRLRAEGNDAPRFRKYVRQRLDGLRHCYAKALAADPELAGEVMVDFRVDPGGVVVTASARGLDDGVDRCVEQAVRAITFPPADTFVQVQVPLDFRSL